MDKRILAFDFGASSGRAMLGEWKNGALTLTEVHRFENNPVQLNGTFYWDVLRLFFEIKQGISKAAHLGSIDSIAIDTWGVDFGLLDKDGNLVQNPIHYRDLRTAGLPEEVEKILGKDKLYSLTGIQVMPLNTLFQFYALAKSQPEILERAECALLMPDLLGYFLTGKKTAEYSMASTTQMLNPNTHQWNKELLDELGIPLLFPDVVPSGTVLGPLREDIQEELGVGPIPVISTTGHDTASAVAAAPSQEDNFIYISCGTWSLFGTELKHPVINEKSLGYNISNEGGYNFTTRFLKNIVGLWLIQETRRQYLRQGETYSYNDLEKMALASKPFQFFIDPDDAAFSTPGNLPRRIAEYCEKTGQGRPQTVGEIMRCIYESLAMKYRYTFDIIRDCTEQDYLHIHMVGGGTKDNLLCRMAASATNRPVVAGPIEATALGNVTVQLLAQGELPDIKAARKMIADSVAPVHYAPESPEDWEAAYPAFRKIIGL